MLRWGASFTLTAGGMARSLSTKPGLQKTSHFIAAAGWERRNLQPSLQGCSYRLEMSARLLCPWDFSGKNTGVGSHFLLQGTFLTQGCNPGLPYCGQILYHLSHQGISHQLHALHVVHQQIGPRLQGSVLAWAAKGIHGISGPKTRHLP